MNSLKPILDFYMERGGASAWAQSRLRLDENGESCAVTQKPAVKWCPYVAACDLYQYRVALATVRPQLHARAEMASNGKYTTIWPWNDSPKRTWEDVEALLSMDDV